VNDVIIDMVVELSVVESASTHIRRGRHLTGQLLGQHTGDQSSRGGRDPAGLSSGLAERRRGTYPCWTCPSWRVSVEG